jgi:hypothetical protein
VTYDEVLGHFKNVRRQGSGKAKVSCPNPGHGQGNGDRNPSVSVEIGNDGDKTVIHCHAGCADKDVMAAAGLTARNLFFDERPAPKSTKRRTCYDYTDEAGNVLSQAVRDDYGDGRKKEIFQRRPDGHGGWINDVKEVRRVVYRLLELRAASPDEPVWLVAGEKCAEIMRSHGFVATTNVAGECKWTAEDSEFVRGRDVVLFCDNDPTGRKDAELKTRLLHGIARSIRVLDVIDLPLKGDCEQYFQAGHTAADLRELAGATKEWSPTAVPAGTTPATEEPESICLATVEPCRVGWLWFGRLASGEMVVITGRPGVGKGLLLCYIVARYTTGRPMHGDRIALPAGHVLWISMEDAHDTSLVPRLLAAGADLSRVHAWNLTKPLSLPVDADRIVAELKRLGCTLLIIDPAPTLLDKDHSSNNDANVRQSFAALSAACRELGCTMILVRHTNKRTLGDAMDRGGGSIGWTGMARVEFMIGRRPVEEGATVADTHESVVTLATVKNNLGKWAPSLNLAIVEAGESARMEIVGETEATADDLCAPDKPRTALKTGTAEQLIRRILSDGQWHRQREIMAAADDSDIGEKTVKRAKKTLPVQSEQRSDGWWWRLVQGDKPKTLSLCPPDPVGGAVPVPSYNNEYLDGHRVIGPHTHPCPPEGQTADDAALDADFNGEDAI